ncbi:fluoride efflux transporter CrcB [Sutcliffiella deserti]|uniref:fluoride efflux transporter CrcB n=1 Tax=Sutcliffiella deserti TaxID=2875501 RepID=UPI001CBDCE7F|nr:fluoride efflux transporter CrcB [Sutcliffiella deserti]
MNEGYESFIVAIGGGVGAVLRYITGIFLMKRFPAPPIPIAMVIVNIIGSCGLGLLMGQLIHHPDSSYHNYSYLFLGLGFFGGFTTFSTFSVEAVQLWKKRLFKKFFLYILISIIGSIIGFMVGVTISL